MGDGIGEWGGEGRGVVGKRKISGNTVAIL